MYSERLLNIVNRKLEKELINREIVKDVCYASPIQTTLNDSGNEVFESHVQFHLPGHCSELPQHIVVYSTKKISANDKLIRTILGVSLGSSPQLLEESYYLADTFHYDVADSLEIGINYKSKVDPRIIA